MGRRTSTSCFLRWFCVAHMPRSSTSPLSCRWTPASTFCGGGRLDSTTTPVSVLGDHYAPTMDSSTRRYSLRSTRRSLSLARDRDALGAAVGVRTIPAPHAALNGAPEALALVHDRRSLRTWRPSKNVSSCISIGLAKHAPARRSSPVAVL